MNWKTIEEYPGYEASDTGIVRSKYRIVKSSAGAGNVIKDRKITERILKPSYRNKYLFVTLRKNCKNKSKMIHHIVAELFIGCRPNGLVINHKNGIKTDNRAENLEYCSISKNSQEFYRLKGVCKGSIPYEDIPKIINRINSGEKIMDIANQYNVKRDDISVLSRVIIYKEELILK